MLGIVLQRQKSKWGFPLIRWNLLYWEIFAEFDVEAIQKKNHVVLNLSNI